MRRRWWIKALLVLYMLPWALPAVPAFISFHWMLIGEPGFLDSVLRELFGIDGPIWFNDRWLALGIQHRRLHLEMDAVLDLIFLAGRMAIPQDIYDAADVDGATGFRRFVHVTFPLLANLYLVCTLLSTIWTSAISRRVFCLRRRAGNVDGRAGDARLPLRLRSRPPAARRRGDVSALPVLIPIVIVLMRRLQTREVQL